MPHFIKKNKYNLRIIAPASSIKNPYEVLKSAIDLLNSLECFEVTVPKDIFQDTTPPFYSNIKEKRQQDLKDALLDDQVDIIWSFKGGYGSSELIDEEILAIKPSNKILIGFSDITTLHFLCNQIYNLISIHGPNINNLSLHIDELMLIKSYLLGESLIYKLEPLNDMAKSSAIEGVIAGGNLTILTSLLATSLHPNLNDKILLLEDVGEKSYRIKRMLIQLEQSGLLSKLKAIIIGDFTSSDLYLSEVLSEFVKMCHFPVFKIESVGHGEKNYPIIFNNNAIINKSKLIISNIL